MTTVLYAHHRTSASARELADALNVRRLFKTRTILRQNNGLVLGPGDVLINWGAKAISMPGVQLNPGISVVNPAPAVSSMSNKVNFFVNVGADDELRNYIPPVARNIEDASLLFRRANDIVVCRTVIDGSSGEGIVLATNPDALVPAPLYTKYIPKRDEFRVHFTKSFGGNINVFALQRKVRVRDVPDANVNWRIRNLDGGFVYSINTVTAEDAERLIALTTSFAQRSPLHFGALDIIAQARDNGRTSYYMLEVNTAPGLSEASLARYVEAFRNAGWV